MEETEIAVGNCLKLFARILMQSKKQWLRMILFLLFCLLCDFKVKNLSEI